MIIWSWNKSTYWTDLDSIKKIINKSNEKKTSFQKKSVQVDLEKIYNHKKSEFNYSFIVDKPKKEFPPLGSDRTMPPKIEKNLEQLAKEKAQEGLGMGLVRLGIALAIPEGPELILPWAWADEIVGLVLIGTGAVLIFGDSIF